MPLQLSTTMSLQISYTSIRQQEFYQMIVKVDRKDKNPVLYVLSK